MAERGLRDFLDLHLVSLEVWDLGREIRGNLSDSAPPSLCLATWGRAGLGFWPTGVLNAAAPLGSAWGLCLSGPGLRGPREEGDGSLWRKLQGLWSFLVPSRAEGDDDGVFMTITSVAFTLSQAIF